MAQDAPWLTDVPEHELEQRRHSLSYAVIWGSPDVAPALREVEQELSRRARMRDLDERERAASARQAAWEEAQRELEQREAEEAQRSEELEEARRQAEEEEARRQAEEERRRREEQIQRLAQEQVEAAREVQAAVDELVALATTFVERDEAMFALAVPDPAETDPGVIAGGAPADADRLTQAEGLLGSFLRSRLSAIPALRLRPEVGSSNGGTNGKRPSLEDRVRSVLGEFVDPTADDATRSA